ncbi:OPA3-like protein [Zancudomyces culisetae]|uniref:OPA3-like protein n=1 Tax=Zancudomyces culisetae TaxID=1213189 RepID=A0A1R1PJS2_ZANCU|nr:OPA3-like protein [Zancudomyces culisetae]|eukprot:OMH81211.1 OPA3-like protein [Zancudomyces culisetae]
MSSIKIGSLMVKTLAKPVAARLKEFAKTNQTFRRAIINGAQVSHRLQTKWRINVLNQKPESVRPYNDQKAINVAVDFIGEAFVFGVAVLLILGETLRSKSASKKEKQKLEDRLTGIEEKLQEIDIWKETVLLKLDSLHSQNNIENVKTESDT